LWKRHGGKNQKWRVIYEDSKEYKDYAKEGLDKESGFAINRDFYIVSRLPMNRVIEAQGNNQIYLKRWVKNRNAQKWNFNGKDKVIRNGHWKNYCMEIPANGKNADLRITSGINSRWW
jgi:hypothetical protein